MNLEEPRKVNAGQFWQKKNSLFTLVVLNCTDKIANTRIVRSYDGKRPKGTTLSSISIEDLARDYQLVASDEDTAN